MLTNWKSIIGYIVLSAAAILLFAACHESSISALDELPSNVQYVVVIPGQGCSGCIGDAAWYCLHPSTPTKRVRYVFTRNKSRKDIKILLGSQMERTDILVDSLNGFFMQGDSLAVYPLLWSRSHGGWLQKVFELSDTLKLMDSISVK